MVKLLPAVSFLNFALRLCNFYPGSCGVHNALKKMHLIVRTLRLKFLRFGLCRAILARIIHHIY